MAYLTIPGGGRAPGRGRRIRLVGLVALGCLIAVLGDLSIRLAPEGTNVAAWWPAAGVAVAVGLRAGRGAVWPIALVTWAASIAANLLGGREPAVAVLFATANATEVAVACLAIMTWNPDLSLRNLRLLGLTAAAATIGAVSAGAVAGAAVAWQLDGDFWVAVRAVWASHLSAVLLFVPFGMKEVARRGEAGRTVAVVTSAVLVAGTLAIFAPGQPLPIVFLIFPLLVVTAFRHSLRTNAVQLILVSTTATAASAAGWGPLIESVRDSGLAPEMTGTLLQTLIISAAAMVFALRITVEAKIDAIAEATQARRDLQAVIESAPSTSIIQTDLDGIIRVFNQGAVNLLGYAEEDIVGRCTPSLFHDADEVAARAAELGLEPGFDVFVHDVRVGLRASDRRDWTFITADGARRQVSLVISRVDDANGNPIGYLGIAEDVSAQRQVGRLLVEALDHERAIADRLRAADQLKSEFVSSVSHELRTPLTSVLGYTEILGDEYADALGRSGAEIIGRIDSNGRRLLDLVDDLLTLSRIESDTFSIANESFDLRAAVRGAVAVVGPIAVAGDICLRCDVPDEPTPLEGDQVEIERVLINLLTNAVKFTPAGGTIDLSVDVQGPDAIVVEVADSGVGIPAPDLEHVFTRFHRGANVVSSVVPGTGLGLAIVTAIVDRHGGEVGVESELDRGTTFTVTLPRHHG
jgi:PAS domain S-box-containing protein